MRKTVTLQKEKHCCQDLAGTVHGSFYDASIFEIKSKNISCREEINITFRENNTLIGYMYSERKGLVIESHPNLNTILFTMRSTFIALFTYADQ